MRVFGSVVEAELPFAAFAFEGQEVELAAEGHLAVGADGVDVGCGHGGGAYFERVGR